MSNTTVTVQPGKPDTKTVTRRRTTTQPKAAAKSTAKATAKPKAAPKADSVRKSDLPEALRDWTYLADKEPTDLHEDMAAWILEATGIEVEDREAFTKAVQLTAVLRMVYQRSDRNKTRGTYRGLDETVVEQRSVHMVAAHQDAKRIRDEREAKAEAAKAAATAKRAATRRSRKPAQAATPA